MKIEFFHPKYWLLWIGLGFLRLLIFLPYPLIMSLGKQLGLLLYYTVKYRRHIVKTNIDYCFPDMSEKEKHHLVRENFIHTGYTLVENPLTWWGKDKHIQKRAVITGIEHLQDALDNSQGVLLLSAHFTALEIGGRILSSRIPITFMYRQHKNKLFEWIQKKSREGQCDKMIERKEVRSTIKALRDKKPVWVCRRSGLWSKAQCFCPVF